MKKILLKIWGAITLVLTVIAYAFFTKNSNRKMREAVDRVKEDAEKEREELPKFKQNIEQRKGKDKKLADKLKNHFYIILMLVFVMSFSWTAIAENQTSSETDIENLIIPADYDTLLIQYKDIAMIAIEYQQLYRKAEEDNKNLVESVERLQKLIEIQQEIIDKLMGRKLGVFTGVNITSSDKEKLGLMIGVNYQF